VKTFRTGQWTAVTLGKESVLCSQELREFFLPHRRLMTAVRKAKARLLIAGGFRSGHQLGQSVPESERQQLGSIMDTLKTLNQIMLLVAACGRNSDHLCSSCFVFRTRCDLLCTKGEFAVR